MHAQTRRQREVLDFIVRFIESHGYRPSYQVIARHMGVSSRAGIARIVADLEAQGFLQRERIEGHFAITIPENKASASDGSVINWLDTPANGDRSKGEPFTLPKFMLGSYQADDIRALHVSDDGLAEIGICFGDVALVELRSFARDGDIVAAIVRKDDPIVRKFYRSGSHIELSGSGHEGPNIRLVADKVQIVGRFLGLLRPIQ